jgi:hypothetical protein
MAVLSRFREDVEGVGAALAPVLGGTLEPKVPGAVHRAIAGTRGDRRVRVELNELHGIHLVACALRELPLRSYELHDADSMFARNGVAVTERLKARTSYDAVALWALLPADTRGAIADLLAPAASSLTVSRGEISALLGPVGLVRAPDAAERVLASLDRLIPIAAVIEERWDVDPEIVGRGFCAGLPAPAPAAVPPPPPPPVVRCDPDAVARAATRARAALEAVHAGAIIEPFPAIDPMTGDLAAIAGKVVRLPPTPPSHWAKDVGYRVVVAGDADRGWYFAPTKEPGLKRVLAATERYERATGVSLADEPYELVARVTGKPRLVVVDGKGRFGLDVATLGAQIGDRLFVDATAVANGEARFAGEPE